MSAVPPLAIQAARDYSATCKSAVASFADILPLPYTITVLSEVPSVPKSALDAIDELEKVVVALPEPTKQDAAQEWLTVAQERIEVLRKATLNQKVAKEQAPRSRQVYDIYAATKDKVLTGIYAAVEKDFASLYGFSTATMKTISRLILFHLWRVSVSTWIFTDTASFLRARITVKAIRIIWACPCTSH